MNQNNGPRLGAEAYSRGRAIQTLRNGKNPRRSELRSSLPKWIVIGIFVLAILSFVFWGVPV